MSVMTSRSVWRAPPAGQTPNSREYNHFQQQAGVAELADAQDLKSWAAQAACGFDSHPRHHFLKETLAFWRVPDPSRGLETGRLIPF